jgi:hypothetical protein
MVVMASCRSVTRSEAHLWPQSRAEADKLIEALKAIRARGWKPKDVEPEEVGTVETEGGRLK